MHFELFKIILYKLKAKLSAVKTNQKQNIENSKILFSTLHRLSYFITTLRFSIKAYITNKMAN